VRKATEYGFDCVQKPMPGDAAPPGGPLSEDCLYLNVWRPAEAASADERLPVMVWIHGGGYVNGGSSSPIFDGSALARQGLVLVSFNYRLGRLGFFAHPALLAANEGPVGNFGYMDQLEALRWVQRNIAAFGGNPGQVTIVGESAGGDSVAHLLTSPAANGLFHRAAIMSGDGRGHLLGGLKLTGGTLGQPSADQKGVNFAASVGIMGTGPETLAKLRALPAAEVVGDLNMADLLAEVLREAGLPTYAGGPMVDGTIVVGSPAEVFQRGEAAKVPLLIGTTTLDIPTTLPPSLEDPLSYFGADADKARAFYNPTGTLHPIQLALTIGADMTMHEPARFAARQMTAVGQPAWLYRFGYVAESVRGQIQGAPHASDLPYLFQTLEVRYADAVTDKDQAAARALSTYFANFAKTGNPNGPGLPNWSNYDPARSDLMIFTPDAGPVVAPDPWKERLDLVERAAEAAAKGQ
jgi:para-nitrobenzyl esterase